MKSRNARRQPSIHRMPDTEPEPDGAISGPPPGTRLNLAQMAFPIRVAMSQGRRRTPAPRRIDEDSADMPDAVVGSCRGAYRGPLLKLQAQSDQGFRPGRAVVENSGKRVHVGEDGNLLDLVLGIQG